MILTFGSIQNFLGEFNKPLGPESEDFNRGGLITFLVQKGELVGEGVSLRRGLKRELKVTFLHCLQKYKA